MFAVMAWQTNEVIGEVFDHVEALKETWVLDSNSEVRIVLYFEELESIICKTAWVLVVELNGPQVKGLKVPEPVCDDPGPDSVILLPFQVSLFG